MGRVCDIIRTRAVVKYVDGVERVLEALVGECKRHGLEYEANLKAESEGYYAGHLVVSYVFEIPSRFDTERVSGFVEVQVTTQIQEVIDQLTHKYYEQRRLRPTPEEGKPWQWRYDSPDFVVYYLGHILHYLEGMLVEVRDRDTRRRSS